MSAFMSALSSLIWFAFYLLIFTPIAIVIRAVKRAFALTTGARRDADSYWLKTGETYRNMKSKY